MFNVLGVGLSFILGTYLVREYTAGAVGATSACPAGGNTTTTTPPPPLGHGEGEELEGVREDIARLLYLQTGASALLLLLVLIYYPRL